MSPEDAAKVKPGSVLLYRRPVARSESGEPAGARYHVIDKRKDDDSGWWLHRNAGGLADFAVLLDEWQLVQP